MKPRTALFILILVLGIIWLATWIVTGIPGGIVHYLLVITLIAYWVMRGIEFFRGKS